MELSSFATLVSPENLIDVSSWSLFVLGSCRCTYQGIVKPVKVRYAKELTL